MTDQSVPKEVCQITDRILKDDVCYGKFNGELATWISTLCSDKTRLSDKNCKRFCDNQVGSKGAFSGACKNTAGSYCADSLNKNKPECACVVYKDSKEYKDLVAKYGQSLTTVNPQCWVSPCLNDTWSEKMRSYDGVCPNTIQICAQTLTISQLTADAVGSIGSVCNLDSSQSSTTVLTGSTPPPAPSTDPPPDLPTNSNTKPNPNGFNFVSGSGVEGTTFIYTDKTDDPDCATNWNYYQSDGKTLIMGNIPRITKSSGDKNFCPLKPVPPPAAAPTAAPPPSSPPPRYTPPPSATPSGLSSTMIAGIVIGGVVLLILLFMLLSPKAPAPAPAAPPIILGR